MRATDTLRLAFAGTRTDRSRVAITAAGAAIAVVVLLSAATVLATEPGLGRYSNRMFEAPTLLGNVALALVLFAVPILFFVAQCARFGAPARTRRMAAFRLAGATPAQVARIAAVETGLASLIGSVVGVAGYVALRAALDAPAADGTRPLPTDVLPPVSALIGLPAAVPVLATLLTVVLLGSVTSTPFGVLHRTRPSRVRAWPALSGVLGLAGFALLDGHIIGHAGSWTMPWVAGPTVLLMLGLTLGTAWLGRAGATLLLRLTRRPSALIAARQALADPYDGSRTYTVLLVTAAFGGAAMMLHAWLTTNDEVRQAASDEKRQALGGTAFDLTGTVAFRAETFGLVRLALLILIGVTALTLMVALLESAATRRRTAAALVAAGTPHGVLARALCWRVLIPTVPGITAACLAGMLAMRSVTRHATGSDGGQRCTGTAAQCADPTYQGAHTTWQWFSVTRTVPIPWSDVAGVGAITLLAVLLVIATTAILQRSTTDPAELRAD